MKNVLVSGGAGGIGSAVVEKFIENGYFVYIVDIAKKEGEALVERLGKDKCALFSLDVTDGKGLQAFAKTLPKDFTINHIVSLAGRALPNEWKPFLEQPLEEIGQSIALNLTGHLNLVHTFLPYLKGEDKSVLLVSSINALRGFGLPAYSAGKAGMFGFTTAVCDEFGQRGVRINTLTLGTVKTPNTEKEPKNFDALLEKTALKKFATVKGASEAAFAMCTILTEMTGQDLVLDAGQMIKE